MKKSLPVLMTMAMTFSIFSSTAFGAGAPKSSADFSDLQNLDATTKAKFDTMISSGIFDGVADGVFGLHDKMNRAQFAKVAALIFGLKVDTALKTSSFSDVSADDPANGYALPYIEALKGAHLTDGFGPNSYNPAGEVTKEQLAAFLIRGLNKDNEAKALTGLSDSTVSGWAKGYAALALQLKLMNNEADGSFGGVSAATRELLVTSSYEAKRQFVPGSLEANTGAIDVADNETYSIAGNTQAQVKSVLQEKTSDGWRIGAVVKLNNTSGSAIRIPDYELRVKAADGTVYTLQPSASNPRSIPSQSKVELTYMAELDVKNDISLTDLLWVDVNQKVYPKQETVLADAPIGSIVWFGNDAAIQDPALLGNWGAVFSIPGESSALKYSATSLSKQFDGQSPSYVVRLKVTNPGGHSENVPDFTLGGKSEKQIYIGKRIEEGTITLNPGEQKYVDYAVTADPNTQLSAFYVLSPASFLKQGQTAPLQFYTGRIGFKLPAGGGVTAVLPAYKLGTPLSIDPLSQAVNPQQTVSLMSLDWFENEGQSFKTAVAKLKFINNSNNPIPLPDLSAELLNGKGNAYSGTRLTSSVAQVMPGVGAMETIVFTVPLSEDANQFTFRLMEQQGKQAYKLPIAQVNAEVSSPNPDNTLLAFYPYEIKLNSWSLSWVASQTFATSAYKLKMDADIHTTNEVVADPGNPRIYMQLENQSGKGLATKTFPLVGDNRLMSGNSIINFVNVNSDQLETPVTLKIYELVSTPVGDARRLLAVLKG